MRPLLPLFTSVVCLCVCLSVCLYVCLLNATTGRTKTNKPINVLFGDVDSGGPKVPYMYCILDGVQNPTGRSTFWGHTQTCPDELATDILNVTRKVAASMQPMATSTVATSNLFPVAVNHVVRRSAALL